MNNVLLYQPGKVGSTSIDYALNAHGIKTLHAHWMVGNFPHSEFPTTKPELVQKILSDSIPPLKVIVPIREAFGRNLSAFMFNLIKYGVNGRTETTEYLRNLFLNKYNIYYPQRWFETELMYLFKFNPFKTKFRHGRGYQIYKDGKHEYLIIRIEDANRVFTKAIKEFLGVPDVEMVHLNTLADKKYIGTKYVEMTKLKYPRYFVDRVYSQRYVQHFYTEKEIEEFKTRWI